VRSARPARRTSPARAAPPRAARRARAAVYLFFFLLGLAVAVWAARIPAVKHGLRLSDGALGVALLALPAGAVLAMPANGWLVDRFGSARVTRLAGVLLGGTLVLPGLAGNLPVLVAALLVLGMAMSLLDVGMNAHGVRVERAYGRPMMSSFHASFSIAGLAGAAVGGLFARAGIGVLPMLAATAVPFVVAAWLGGRWLVPRGPAGRDAEREPIARPAGGTPVPVTRPAGGTPVPAAHPAGDPQAPTATDGGAASRRLWVSVVLLGFVGVCATLGEGAATDWSAVYLHDVLGSSQAVAPAAFAAFSVAMTAGRLLGDRLALRFGPVRLVRGCGLLTAAGLGGALLTTSQVGAVAGFAVMGAGLSCIVPQLFSAAGQADPARAGRLISRVAGISYVGIVGGPAVIGGLADRLGLPVALSIPVVLALLIAVTAGVLAPRGAPPQDPDPRSP
jgi:MFS family permease